MNFTALLLGHQVVSDSVTAWTAACQASLYLTISQSWHKFMSIESVTPFKHLHICCPHLLPQPSNINIFLLYYVSESLRIIWIVFAAAKLLQSCPTLCNPIDGSPPGSPCPWDSPGENTGVGCHFLLFKYYLQDSIYLCQIIYNLMKENDIQVICILQTQFTCTKPMYLRRL